MFGVGRSVQLSRPTRTGGTRARVFDPPIDSSHFVSYLTKMLTYYILGGAGVGKTALYKALTKDTVDSVTISGTGCVYGVETKFETEIVVQVISDVGEVELISKDAFYLVMHDASPESIVRAQEILNRLVNMTRYHENIFILQNKADLPGGMTTLVEFANLPKKTRENAQFYSCVDHSFDFLSPFIVSIERLLGVYRLELYEHFSLNGKSQDE